MQIITMIGSHLFMLISVFGIVWWFRKETREDWKMCNTEIKEMREEFKQFRDMWVMESKDFHARLLKIEMERK